MPYTYWLPDEHGNKQDITTESNAVIIIGANGSGKSKLGAWIEQQNIKQVHRISAQRNLNFSENIPLKSYTEAENRVLYGTDDEADGLVRNKGNRWNFGKSFTTTLLNDFNDILAALLAKYNNEAQEYMKSCRQAEQKGETKPAVPVSVIEKLFKIWHDVLPQRKLIQYDSRFDVYIQQKDTSGIVVGSSYSATQMSDGERAVLYLAAQVLCVPYGRTMIIDEPEIHLHPTIMNSLWNSLERTRPDCLFIYITHDVHFASAHSQADKIWIKEFDGKYWSLEKITSGDLPEEILLKIIGSRKRVLLVEGEGSSYDTRLYSELYPKYCVIPCGSCTQVIAWTKAFRNNPTLHDNEVYGIIDRDFRSDYEIEQYKTDGIYTIGVAEVENLFIVEELVRLVAAHLGLDPDEIFEKVKKYVINDRFAKQIEGQICESVVAQIKYMLSSAEISKKNENEARATLDAALDSIDFDSIKQAEEKRFRDALNNGDYKEILKLFNKKSIAGSVGHFFGINNEEYCQMIIRLLHGQKHDEIITSLLPYMPVEIPRTQEA